MEASWYYPTYLTLITLLTAIMASQYARYPNSRLSRKGGSSAPALVLTIAMTLWIGLRPISILFTDMVNYLEMYRIHRYWTYFFDSNAENFLFDNIYAYMSYAGYDIYLFFLLIAAIYFGGMYIALKKLFPKDALYALIIYLGAFSTFSYGTNGIKAGAAASLFLCAIAYRRQTFACIVFLIVSLGFHHSMVMPIAAFVICWFYSNPKNYLTGWVICLIIAALHITVFQEFFGSMGDESAAGYLSTQNGFGNYYTGFRIDFVIYSAAPVFLGNWVVYSKGYRSRFYNFIYCTYTLTNAVWMLCMYASFTNRIAYLSWLMLPIVLIYPFFDYSFIPRQYKKLNIVAWCHIGFTLAMQIVYYGFLKSMI